ncbi:hypothetical protein L7F22_021578 [Adiantum nelumboides]|nr:hypothetical protein [Adiantum nelumboides]
MTVGLDTQEEEIHFIDIGQGSLHEGEEIFVSEDNNLQQIIPWEMKVEVAAEATKMDDEQDIYVHSGADVLQKTHIFSCFDCPHIG